MGKQGGAWNNFVWEINTNTMPLNLTAALGGRNEDPKFSFDGKQIYFKHDFDIVIANLTYSNDKITGVSGWKYITNDRWNAEDSMPYPTPSGKYILYTIGSTALSIYRMNTQTGVRQLLTPTPADAHDYYPTVRDYSTYFFTRGVPVTHWDQLMMVQPNVSPTPIALALNDCNSNNSDPSPMDEDYLLFSSSRYDRPYGLMIGDISNGKVWRFSQSTVNVSDGSQKIGSSYTPYH
jgi:Tol biopolymer transport system component